MTAGVARLPTRTVLWRMRASRPGLTLSAVNNPTPKELVMDYKLEVVVVPVRDVDAAKSFYERIGYHTSSSPTSRRPVQSSTTPAVDVGHIEDFPSGRFVYFSDPDGNRWAVQQFPTSV